MYRKNSLICGLSLALLACAGNRETTKGPSSTPTDADGDGFTVDSECDDTNPDIHPGEEEVPFDGIDNDCDGDTDCADPDLNELEETWAGDAFAVDIPSLCEGLCSQSIGGDLAITSEILTTLDGLECVMSIAGSLVIAFNPQLTDVTALYGLQYVGGDVEISLNTSLTEEDVWALVDEIDVIGGQIIVSTR